LSEIVLIVGTGRCGSHYLRDILGLHKDIKGSFENYFVASILRQLGFGSHPVNDMLATVKQNCDGNGLKHFDSICASVGLEEDIVSRELISTLPQSMSVSGFIAELHSCLFGEVKIIADKSHAYGAILPDILSVLEGAKVLNIVRDGVAVARSMALHSGYRKVVGNGISPEELPYMFCEGGLEKLSDKSPSEKECFMWWLRAVECCLNYGKLLGPERFVSISYEDIVTGSVDTFSLIADFLNIELDHHWVSDAAAVTYPNSLQRQYGNFTQARYDEILNMGRERVNIIKKAHNWNNWGRDV